MHTLFSAKSNELLLIVAGCTTLLYLYVVVLLRLLGRHTISQLSAVDLLIVMLLGSSVETSLIHGSTLLRCGLVSATVLIVINRLLTAGMLRSKSLRNLVGGGPIVLVNHGKLIEENLIRAGLTRADVLEALRERECGDPAEVRIAVMEQDGVINVVTNEGTA